MSAVSTVPTPKTSGHWPAPPPFLCTTRMGGAQAAWIHVAGELDLLTAPQLKRTLRDAQLHNRVVVLDMRDVSFIDSAGLHLLLAASQQVKPDGTQLRVIPSPVVSRMLGLGGGRWQIPTIDLAEAESAPSRRPRSARSIPRRGPSS
jgi:anti-sigma B factor antagonist